MPGTVGLPALAAVLAAAVALPLVAFGPPGGDAPAHLYRAALVRDGVLLWDNLWYAGHYPLASYSLLYYFPAALVGNLPLALAGVLAAAALFASLCEREWGLDARWPSLAFAVAAAGPLLTGTYPYALGLAAALAALWALRLGRLWLAALAAALTLGFSPLAFLFLCLALLAVAVARRRLDRRAVVVAAAVALVGAVQAAAVTLFPHDAEYPFFWPVELLVVVAVGGLGALVALRSRRGGVLAAFLGLWALAALLAFVVPSPVGENVTRLRGVAFPLVLLAAVLARFRPAWLAVPLVAFALGYNLIPYVTVVRTDERVAAAEFWAPAVEFLRARSRPGERLHVVATDGHWEAYRLPAAGFAITRGWYRQLDFPQNAVLYEDPLEPAAYRGWLRRLGVRYVLLPAAELGRKSEEREAALLRSGRSGLRPVGVLAGWRIYELSGARGILPGGRITELSHERLAGSLPAAGAYRLAVRFTPYWKVRRGALCLAESSDGMTEVRARRPGPFVLEISFGGRGSASCER
jgi:hypothetical protein